MNLGELTLQGIIVREETIGLLNKVRGEHGTNVIYRGILGEE